MNYTDPNELLEVVDARDRVVGTEPRWLIHQKGLMHRAVHVLVFNPAGLIYLQRRSAQKDTNPLKWTSSASGHVDPGEGYDSAAMRELKEELGISARPEPLGKLGPHPDLNNEFAQVYLLNTGAEPVPNPDEIIEGRFFKWSRAVSLAHDPALTAPCLKHVLRIFAA